MDKISKHLNGSVGLLRAVEVASNWHAFVLLASSGFAALVLIAIGAKLGSVLGILFAVLALIVLLTGFSATGIVLMDDAKGFEARSLTNAALAGLFTIPRFLALGLLAIVAFLLYILVLAILYFVCKIPGIGAFLYAFVFPTTALLTGIVFLALSVAFLVLAAPLVWERHGVMVTLARLWTVLRHRLLMVYMNELLLILLVFVVGGLVMAVVALGTLITMPLSVSIIGQNVGGGGIGGITALMMGGGLGSDEVSGYLYAGIFGSAILGFIAVTLPLLVHTKGVCLIYLASVEGLEFDQAEATLAQRISEVKQRAEAVRERSMQATHNSVSPATGQAPVHGETQSTEKPVTAVCPKCDNRINPGDMFCESCGHRLFA